MDAAQIEVLQSEAINALRIKEGLPPRDYKPGTYRNISFCRNPARATVTSFKTERGFVYLNLNGGDSYGYYHPESQPEVVYNFKDEPNYRTKDLDPDYYERARQHAAAAKKHARQELQREAVQDSLAAQKELYIAAEQHESRYYCMFRDRATDDYYVGYHDYATGQNSFYQVSSKDKGFDYLLQHGAEVPEVVPTWDYVFDPTRLDVFDPTSAFVNQFVPTPFLKRARRRANLKVPGNIRRVILSAVGGDQELFDHFVNWLAVIVQYRICTQTAWVLQGTTGTGKGMLFHLIIKPLLGDAYCRLVTLTNLEDQFNQFIERTIVLFVDEADTDQIKNGDKLTARLKSMITEPKSPVRAMQTDLREVPNHINIITASNRPNSMRVEGNDRRFNVCPRQETKLLRPDEDGAKLVAAIEAELPDFADYLISHEADRWRARTAIENDPKRQLQVTTQTAMEEVAEALIEGDLAYFISNRLTGQACATVCHFNSDSVLLVKGYSELLRTAVTACRNGQRHILQHKELFVLFEGLVGKMPETKAKLTKRLAHAGIDIKPQTLNHTSIRGHSVQWSASDAYLQHWTAEFEKEEAEERFQNSLAGCEKRISESLGLENDLSGVH